MRVLQKDRTNRIESWIEREKEKEGRRVGRRWEDQKEKILKLISRKWPDQVCIFEGVILAAVWRLIRGQKVGRCPKKWNVDQLQGLVYWLEAGSGCDLEKVVRERSLGPWNLFRSETDNLVDTLNVPYVSPMRWSGQVGDDSIHKYGCRRDIYRWTKYNQQNTVRLSSHEEEIETHHAKNTPDFQNRYQRVLRVSQQNPQIT